MMLAWCGANVKREAGGGSGANCATLPRCSWQGMTNPGSPYQGCVGQGMNFAEHPYEGRTGSQPGGGYPYQVQYHPSPSPQYPSAQHCVGGGPPYGNVQGHLGQFVQRQQYSPDMRYTPCHAPAYPSSPAPPHAKPAPNWSSPDHHGGSFPQMMAPHRSPAGNQQMASYRPMVGPPPQSHSPSWSQSPRTTPSPLACHARSPVATQPPFSPPTPAPTPQLQAQQQQSAASPCGGGATVHDPLQSLEKMVLLEPQGGGASFGTGGVPEMVPHQQPYVHGAGSPSSPFPTYYNMDQNRMCTPPGGGYADASCYRSVGAASNGAPADARTAGAATGLYGGGVNGVLPVGGGGYSADPQCAPTAPPPPRLAGGGCGSAGSGAAAGEYGPPLGASTTPPASAREREELAKRRRSSDSVLCGRIVAATMEDGAEGSNRKRRRSTAGIVPDAPPHPQPTQSANPARPVKLEPETSGSEADREREPASEVSSVGTDSAAATSDAASPAKRKRGRPFGAKNKVKEGGAPKGRRKPDARKLDAAPATTPVATTLAPRGKLSGPYVRVVGTRERPMSTSVVNVAPRSAAEEEVRRKKGASTPGQRSLHGARRLPGAAGGHTSTLSPHYDAVTRDPTWLCAFCHRGSHHQGLGDLYGPYPGIPARLPTDAATDGASGCEDGCRRGKGKRRKSDSGSEDTLARATLASRRARQRRPSEVEGGPAGEACGGASRELWVHEACATWTQGVYLGGHRVHGLQEAAQEAALLACCKCKLPGASVGCVTRGCAEKYHYQCAVERGCHLDFENFSVLCSRHKVGWKPAA